MKKTIKTPFILGLTGGVGAGKSTILDYLDSRYGFHVIQADQVAKRLMEPGMESYEAVADALGPGILAPDGTLDRTRMAELIFGDPKIRRQVDEITHPLVWKALFREAKDHINTPVVIEAAIPSKEFRDNCREMWYVYTSRENRQARLMASRGYSQERCRKMMESQASEEAFRAFADRVIDNNGRPEEVRAQIDALAAGWEEKDN